MAAIVFGGVSPRSLGDLLKGYGIMAVLGEECPEALFWWDDAFHLWVEWPCDQADDTASVKNQLRDLVRRRLVEFATAFKRTWKKSSVNRPGDHDRFPPELAGWARAIALPHAEPDKTEPHPLFRQEGRGDYFSQIGKAAEKADTASEDLSWSLFAESTRPLSTVLDSGYLFFPEAMKRYATGLARWEREKDAPRSPWDFLLAVRGALLLRGSLRRLRWGRRAYPAFPFVFEGQTVKLSRGGFFRNVEIHLPTWRSDRPRTLSEFELQVRQFQARLSVRGFAATAAEFRAAVVGRGVGAAFDTFHRFVLEGRRPGQRKPMSQQIPRGATRVGGQDTASGKLRLMLAPLAETGWFDQFVTEQLRAARARAEEAIHRAVDEPGLESYRGVLAALWDLNRSIVLPGALRRDLEQRGRTPQPLPPLPVQLWEEALQHGLQNEPAYRLGRAIGSILGLQPRGGGAGVGPVLEHMLPVRYNWDRSRWVVPKDGPPPRPLRWTGLDPLRDFQALLWWRWLDSGEADRLPFPGARCASLEDIAALLRGEVDIREVHKLAGLFALLDWQNENPQPMPETGCMAVLPSAYVALRLLLELGIRPAPGSRPPRDGQVVRLLSIGQPATVERAAVLALRRLSVNGLPWESEPSPMGKAVARFKAVIGSREAALLTVAVIVPIDERDRLLLSRRLWVPMDEKEVTT